MNVSSVWACLEPRCGVTVVAPGDGTHLPANAPAIAVSGSAADNVLAVDILGPDGRSFPLRTVPANLAEGGTTFVGAFDAPLEVGASYTIRRTLGCKTNAGVATLATAFTVDPPAPFPTSIGVVTVSYQVLPIVERDIYGGLPGTSTGVNASVAQLRLEVSPELAPYLPVTRFVTSVDGTEASSAYGKPFALSDGADVVSRADVSRAYAACGVLPSQVQCGPVLQPGTHHVRIEARIAGASVAPPPIELEITLRCPTPEAGAVDAMDVDASSVSDEANSPQLDASAADPATASDAARPPMADAPTGAAPPAPANDAEGRVPAASDTIGGGACAVVALGSSRPSWPALVAFGALFAMTRRRRRS